MSDISKYMGAKYRTARKKNTQWALYAFEKGIIRIDPEAGEVYSTRGLRYKTRENAYGYKQVTIKIHTVTMTFFVHKLVYLWMHGSIPTMKEIDHIDRNHRNNNWKNLRAVTKAENMKNVTRLKEAPPAL